MLFLLKVRERKGREACAWHRLDEGEPFSVFPNPAIDFISFEGLPENSEIDIVDQAGNLVLQTSCAEGSCRFDVSSLSSGSYIAVSGDQFIQFVKH